MQKAGAAEDAVYSRTRAAIVARRLPPGTRLRELRLADIFGAPRRSVRKALDRLQFEGLVELEPNRGAVVARPSEREAADLFAARKAIEGAVGRAVAARASAADLERLRRHVGREAEAAEAGDKTRVIELSGKFHVLLAEIAGNATLLRYMRDIIARESLILELYQSPRHEDCPADEHAAIVAALAASDAEALVSEITRHIDSIAGRLDFDTADADPPTLEEVLGAPARARHRGTPDLQEGSAMITPRRVGMLTPSSNTVLEPVTSAIFAQLGDAASVHFARFRVVEISASESSISQFDPSQILDAAERLAEARVDCIAWNGTAASWLGLDRDRELCARIEERTGIAATSTMLAYDAYLRDHELTRIGLVSPYLTEIQERIIANYGAQGIEIVADRRLEDPGNFSYAEYAPETIADLVRDVAVARPQAVFILCTNFRGAPVAEALEAELDIPVIDSISITAAATMRQVGLGRSSIEGYGSVFRWKPPASTVPDEEHDGRALEASPRR